MARFRKKPVEIDAWQFGGEPVEQWPEWLQTAPGVMRVAGEGLRIRTLEGDMLAREGDYIIRGVAGELYPCKPEIFEATYEPA
jgi:hypothetical protein